jgi:ferritin-like metal-binding protein YciE
MADLTARDAKLVQFLNEAYAKEAELEADLAAHINLTQKAPYKKRLQQHLRETKDHKKRVAQRIKQLGGSPSSGISAPGMPEAASEVVGKAIAAVKGQVGVARAALTQQAETHLRNAREELREEYVEIATYSAIEAFATEVGDRQTAQLAKSIHREEQKTADYLERLIPQLVKDVVKAEIPRDQRVPAGRRRRTTTRPRTTAGRARATASSSRTRTSAGRSTARKATSTARRATKAAATGARSGARAAGTSAKRSAAGSRGGSASGNGRRGSRASTNVRGRSRSASRTTAASR